MGLLFSRKKAKSSRELLEELDNDIKQLTVHRQRNIYQEKSFVSYLLILSFIAYLIGALIFYFYYSPHSWLEYGLYSIPLVLFPIIVYLMKKLLNMYFAHRKAQCDQELSNLQAEKRRILNEVMDKETFNVARELLQRFDPHHPLLRATREERSQRQTPQQRGGGELRQRRQAQTPHPALMHQQHTVTPARPSQPASLTPSQPPTLPPSQPAQPPTPTTPSAAPRPPQPPQPAQAPAQPPQPAQYSQLPHVPSHHATQFIPPGMCLGPAPGPPTPSPILPRERSNVDKMVEYLVGDGPNNRYALICSSCHSHNGMALRDEFEYISFRCAYCYHMNPARRNKPSLSRTLTPATLPGDPARADAEAESTSMEDERRASGGGTDGQSMEDERRASDGGTDGQSVVEERRASDGGSESDPLTQDQVRQVEVEGQSAEDPTTD